MAQFDQQINKLVEELDRARERNKKLKVLAHRQAGAGGRRVDAPARGTDGGLCCCPSSATSARGCPRSRARAPRASRRFALQVILSRLNYEQHDAHSKIREMIDELTARIPEHQAHFRQMMKRKDKARRHGGARPSSLSRLIGSATPTSTPTRCLP